MKNEVANKKISCPACSSEKLTHSIEKKDVTVPFAKSTSMDISVYHCETCGESGDFARENDVKYLAVEDSAKKQSVEEMLSHLNEYGISMAYFERSMQLPTRTIARWKEGNFSSSALALLRVVRTFPWILTVAETGFKEMTSQTILVKEAGKVVISQAIASGVESGAVLWTFRDDRVEINAKLTLANPLPEQASTSRYFLSTGG